MRRRLYTIVSAISLVIFLATGVMWVRSHFAQDDIYASFEFRAGSDWNLVRWRVDSVDGTVKIGRSKSVEPITLPDRYPPGPVRSIQFGTGRTGPLPRSWATTVLRVAGFGFDFKNEEPRPPFQGTSRKFWIAFPWWLPCFIGVFLPTRWILEKCGYDVGGPSGREPQPRTERPARKEPLISGYTWAFIVLVTLAVAYAYLCVIFERVQNHTLQF